jgi:MFS family permease
MPDDTSPSPPARGLNAAFARWRADTLAPLQADTFRAFWVASLVSNLGGMMQNVGAAWLMGRLTPDPAYIAFVQAAASLPLMLFSLIAGALADLYDRRLVMLSALGLNLLAAVGLGVLTVSGAATPWMLLSFTFALGVGAALFAPAWQASVREVASEETLAQAVALNSLSFNLARSVGPALGGVLVGLAGAAAAFIANALSYVGMLIVLLGWRRPHTAPSLAPREPLFAAMGAGVRYVRLSPTLLAILTRGALFGFAGAGLFALIPIVARDALKGDAGTLGLLLGAFGVGAMIGALSSGALRAQFSFDRLTGLGALTFALASAGTAASGGSLAGVLVSLMIGGGAWMVTNSTLTISVQTAAPRWVAGRAIALFQMAAFAGIGAGSAVWGHFTREIGLGPTLFAAAGALVLTWLLFRFAPIPDLTAAEAATAIAGPVRPAAAAIEPRAGPIVIEVAYRVAIADAAAFAEAANALGRARERNGARNWSLAQDIDEPTLWVERYLSPTWADHLRRVERFTKADEAVRDRVRALLAEPEPNVRRYLQRPDGAEPIGVAPRPATTDGGQM